MNKVPLTVVYHNPCADGTASLWSVLTKIPNATTIPCKAGFIGSLDLDIKGELMFVDMCPDYNVLNELSKRISWITILDHHESGFKMYRDNYNSTITDQVYSVHGNVEFHLDNNRAGCQITWDYFYPNIARFSTRPWFLNYIADRDLWTWLLKDSREINQGLFEMNLLNIESMTMMKNMNKNEINEIKLSGAKALKIFNDEVKKICDQAIETTSTINSVTYNAWLVNCGYKHKSEVGNVLSKKPFKDGTDPDFASIWNNDPNSTDIWISLRNCDNIDLSVVSKQYDPNGGGHKRASGFTIRNKSLHDVFVPN